MKNRSILAFILVICISSFAQKKVGGFYKGTLFNDSTKMVQQYELALAEYRGKIMGYSYVTFVVNDTFYYGIRKIKAKIVGDSMIVEDDKMIANNFPESPAKHVNRTVTIPCNGQNSLTSINGRWKTNKTRVYYAVPGSVEASKSNDSSGSALFAHLKELNLMPNDNYVTTETRPEKDDKTQTKTDDNAIVAETETKTKKKEDKIKLKTEEKPIVTESKVKVKKEENKIKTKEQPAIVETKTEVKEANKTKTESKPVDQQNVSSVLPYTQRKDHQQKSVDIASDSLVLSFYDNGVVDGDSISVYLNDQSIISTKLTSVATKKPIYIGGMDEVRLVLVAENLGTIPPNTGLLIIRDGDKTYQVNFTADMQTNASIILKRKRNQ
jgi:hypothetical protein